jgi:hypothetical protein
VLTGALPDEVTQGRIHQAAPPVAKMRRALAPSIETKLPPLIKVSYSSAFFWRERTLGAFVRERLDSPLHLGVGTQPE